jgi:predicted kinase
VGAHAIVVNGLPGVGKSTLAAALSDELNIPAISRDAIKEALADFVDVPLPTSRVGAIASDTLWALAGLIEGPVIVESFWFSGRDEAFFEQGLSTAGIVQGVEIWCEAPVGIVRKRFRTRPRHPVHNDLERQLDWEQFALRARPISTLPVIRVNTSAPVDIPWLATQILAHLPR